MRPLLAILFITGAFGFVACGITQSTPVTVGGNTLTPKSSVFFSLIGHPWVVVSDTPDLCQKFKDSMSGDCNRSDSSMKIMSSGTTLTLLLAGAQDGEKLQVVPSDAGQENPFFKGAVVAFATTDESGKTTFAQEATSGWVQVDQYKQKEIASGRYDVTFANGEKAAGTYGAKYCEDFLSLLETLGKTRSCSASGSGSGSFVECGSRCTCDGKQVSANCRKPTDGGTLWTCTCTSAQGVASTCSMPPTSASDSWCAAEGSTCCPMTF